MSVRAKFTPGSGTLTAYLAPFSGKTSCAHYGLFVTQAGEVWVTITAVGIIARLDVAANQFVYYTIPTSGSLPLGLVMGAHNTLWFTEAGSNKVGMLQP